MARKDRVSMDRKAQILILHKRGYSMRGIALSLNMCAKSVKKFIQREMEKKPTDNQGVTQDTLGPSATKQTDIITQFPPWLQEMDWQYLLQELEKGVTYKILYKELAEEKVTYWAFWHTLKSLRHALKPEIPTTTMRLKHAPGAKTFVDYADGIDLVDPITGEITKTELFVGTMPFSSKTFAEFVFDQKIPSFIASHERMWRFFGGITAYTVSDNLKSAVTKAHIYDPDVNRTFCAYTNHAGFAVLPARPRRPKDKANVESHVGILQRSFYLEVRNKRFTNISELNDALKSFLHRFNDEVMKDYGVSRNQRFEHEKDHLGPLPPTDFEVPDIKAAVVHPDCHVQFCKGFYSVPWLYVGKTVRVVGTATRVEIYDPLSLERIALHTRAHALGIRMTDELHWPPEKREHCDFTIERAKQEGVKVGPHTSEMFEYLFNQKHPLQYLRRTQGWLRKVSQTRCSREAMEYAASMALRHKRFRSSYVNDCIEFFESGGLTRTSSSSAPVRQRQFMNLQDEEHVE